MNGISRCQGSRTLESPGLRFANAHTRMPMVRGTNGQSHASGQVTNALRPLRNTSERIGLARGALPCLASPQKLPRRSTSSSRHSRFASLEQ
eukprot:1117131-Pleurochrysis_carterae.AAC.4